MLRLTASLSSRPIRFEDLVATLNQIAPYDWRSFLRERLDSTGGAPLGGITGGGWKLVYTDEPNEFLAAADANSGGGDFTSSIGLKVKADGTVVDSTPGMPAFESGVSPYLQNHQRERAGIFSR